MPPAGPPGHTLETGQLPAVLPRASHSGQLEVTLLTQPGLLPRTATSPADKGGFFPPLGLQAPQMPHIPGAGESGGSCGL